MFSSYKIEGIILKRTNFGEADKILTVFAKNYGKIKCLAKGVRKISSRRAPHIELFNYTRLTLHKGRNFDIITEADTINSFSIFKKNVTKVASAYYLTEIADKLCPEYQEHNLIFAELLKSLSKLNDPLFIENKIFLSLFSRFILAELGYLPNNQNIGENEVQSFIENIIEKKLKTKELLIRLH